MKWYESLRKTNIDLLLNILFTTPIEVILTWLNTTQECDAGEERGESKVKRMLRQQQLSDISDGYISIANTFEGDEGIIEMGLRSSKTGLLWPSSKDITWIPISNVLNPTRKERNEDIHRTAWHLDHLY